MLCPCDSGYRASHWPVDEWSRDCFYNALADLVLRLVYVDPTFAFLSATSLGTIGQTAANLRSCFIAQSPHGRHIHSVVSGRICTLKESPDTTNAADTHRSNL
jgi:hypothetical protein